ncbi:MAG: alpha/beta fold hydrolase [Chlamydiales bacterium]|nr:alpha/beta fold hydrolase [Chlamydiales bacterium]
MPKALINGKECHYQDVGEGFPILFGHSFLWSSEMWKPQLDTLSKEFRCIAPDLWNHGESGEVGAAVTMESIADDMYALMQSLGISEFAVVGLSVGGMWGAELALMHPEAVKALVIMDSYLGREPEVTQNKYFCMLDVVEAQKGFPPPLLEQIVPLFFSPYTLEHNQDLVQSFWKALAATPKKNAASIARIGRAIFTRKNRLEQLKELAMPVAVMVGKDDIPRPPEETQEMAHLSGGELHVIENAGHIANLEQPQEVTSLLRAFLERSIVSKGVGA